MILKFFIHFFLIIAITLPAVSEMKLQRFSISTYSNSGNFNQSVSQLGSDEKFNSAQPLSVIRVGFRQYANPFINSSSSLTLDNRFTLMDGQNAETRGQVLFYPNPFRIRDGAILQYYLNKPETVRIEIYNIFGKMLFRTIRPSGSDGGRNNVNKLEFNASVFRYFDAPAGVYFLYIINQENKIIGQSKFGIIP